MFLWGELMFMQERSFEATVARMAAYDYTKNAERKGKSNASNTTKCSGMSPDRGMSSILTMSLCQ